MTAAAETPTPTEPVSVDDAEQLANIIAGYSSVLVEFYADWCGPCQSLDPVLESIARELPTVVAKVDIETNRELAFAHRARSVPMMQLYRDGEQVMRIVGRRSAKDLRGRIRRYEE